MILTVDLRPDWKELHMLTAIKAGTRTSCLKRGVGAVLVRNKREIVSGYNGAPSGMENCLIDLKECFYERLAWEDSQKGHGPFELLKEARKIFCIARHAEANAIQQCLDTGVSPKAATLFVTNFPCPRCVIEYIIPNKLAGVIVWKDYLANPLLTEDELTMSVRLLRGAKVSVEKMDFPEKRIREIMEMHFSVGDKTKYVFQP
ncbi:MAG: deaminase [Candidatus Zambryskibacteria bacterium]|nr:deaminase [Candidatus Zambryskibacteria bacterium]